MESVLASRSQIEREGQLNVYVSLPHRRFEQERQQLFRSVLPFLRNVAEPAGVRIRLRCMVGEAATPMQRRMFLAAG
jgi:hypothetical protein